MPPDKGRKGAWKGDWHGGRIAVDRVGTPGGRICENKDTEVRASRMCSRASEHAEPRGLRKGVGGGETGPGVRGAYVPGPLWPNRPASSNTQVRGKQWLHHSVTSHGSPWPSPEFRSLARHSRPQHAHYPLLGHLCSPGWPRPPHSKHTIPFLPPSLYSRCFPALNHTPCLLSPPTL